MPVAAQRDGLSERSARQVRRGDHVRLLPRPGRTGKKNLRDFVESGKGVVVLHHALAQLPEVALVVSGRGRRQLSPGPRGGRALVDRQERPADIASRPKGEHPITAGIGPFHIVDETYRRMWISPRVRPLLTTDNPNSDRVPGLDRPLRGLEGGRDPAWPRPHGVRPSVLPGAGAQRHPVGGGTDQVTAASAPGLVPDTFLSDTMKRKRNSR